MNERSGKRKERRNNNGLGYQLMCPLCSFAFYSVVMQWKGMKRKHEPNKSKGKNTKVKYEESLVHFNSRISLVIKVKQEESHARYVLF